MGTKSLLLHSGELAKKTGVSVDTIRHYERIGVLPRMSRTEGGYRLYPESMPWVPTLAVPSDTIVCEPHGQKGHSILPRFQKRWFLVIEQRRLQGAENGGHLLEGPAHSRTSPIN
jgi:hypothetical protein